MEKKNKGKIVVIVILVLVILGLGSYIVYDKNNTENKISDYDKQIKDLKNQIENKKQAMKVNKPR